MFEKANFQKAKEAARRILEENFITQPPIPVEELVQYEGLGLILSRFDDGEIAGVINLETKYLLVNSNDSSTRQRFTIAHELGHWILHRELMQANKDIAVLYRKPLGGADSDPLEQEANFFAANLLVPEEMLKEALKEDLGDDSLANRFNVSRSVIGYRRKLLGV
jgi:Zn-dependent peptidase ImmA (M78 family)